MFTGQPVFLFWQPHTDYLRLLSSSKFSRKILISLNYAIWLFFFYLSYLLVKNNFSFFWLLFLATLLAEILERFVKKKKFWCRPMFLHHDRTPSGLVDKWYRSGAFPSGHTIKAVIFLLFLIFTPFIISSLLVSKSCWLVKIVTSWPLFTNSSANIFIYIVIPETLGK